jgi:23S rRNA pseudouridine1911/1915/1917 synthase
MEILFEDYYICVIIKPTGMVTEGTEINSVQNALYQHLGKKFPGRKHYFLGFPNRLDKPVKGILVVAKTPMALKNIGQQFMTRKVQKKYLAWVEGTGINESGVLENYMMRDTRGKKAIVTDSGIKGAKLCRLKYTTLKKTGNKTLVEIELYTGRYHQIRMQFSATGNPIVGDVLYGSQTNTGEIICLWSSQLSFTHPKTQQFMEFSLERGEILSMY